MPYTKGTGLYYPKKGSAEAREWAAEMRSLQKGKKKRKTYKRNMVVQCAWCKKIMKKSKDDKDDNVSHGICKKCFKIVERQAKSEAA